MRWTIKTEGGLAHFPGLAGPFAVEESEVREEEAARLRGRVEASRFFELPEELPAGGEDRGARDVRRHAITVEDAGRSRTVRISEPVGDPHLWELVYELEALRTKRGRGG